MRLSGATNAHAELPNQSNVNYNNNLVCCSGVTGLSNSCSGTYGVVARLAGATNAHIEQNNQSNPYYTSNACISVASGGSVSVGYRDNDCSGFDTTVASMTGTTNAHSGNASAYTKKICASASAPSGGGGGGGGGGYVPPPPVVVPPVIAPVTPIVPVSQIIDTKKVCKPYLLEYIKLGAKNNPVEVKKLQWFLKNKEGFINVKETGVYDAVTYLAVKTFQERYSKDILSPYGALSSTGWVYVTTVKKINDIMGCQGEKVIEKVVEKKIVKECQPYLLKYIKLGAKNSVVEVKKLQKFLKDYEGFVNVKETGIYDAITFLAVRTFQERYSKDVLSPYGALKSTGWVYVTTVKKINELMCTKYYKTP